MFQISQKHKNNQPSIVFHIIDDKKENIKYFFIYLDFLGKTKIKLTEKLIIDEKYFPKTKNKG